MTDVTNKSGVYTEAEIHSQPRCWAESLRGLEQDAEVERIVREFSHRPRWVFVGCGSSYYLALAAAASWKALTGLPATAVPASELLLFPELSLERGVPAQPVLISRSGTTSEVLKVGEFLNAQDIPFIAVTCTSGEALQAMATTTICPAAAHETSTVMTLSFTSMLIAIQFLAAKLAGNRQFITSLQGVPEGLQSTLGRIDVMLKGFVDGREFEDYVWLGQGPYYGLACEGALKVKEMSCSYAQNFHTLEFRHGPKSIVRPQTLIMFQLSQPGLEAECGVLEEVKQLGGTTLVVANEANDQVRRFTDLLIELHPEAEEYASLAARIVPAQLLGLYTGLKKGLDPDHPRNLTRVVLLDD
jgi:glutamine---fructose-6-phosphate transaminase (isomerizing)